MVGNSTKPLTIAHRGFSGEFPENTLAAFVAAAEAGADWCELDVHLSCDREIFVIHDETVDRTTDGHGAVSGLMATALKSLDAGRWFREEYAGERIPTLDEVFEAVGRRCEINIELKGKGTGEAVAELIRRRQAHKRVMVSSFDFDQLEAVARLDPTIRIGVLGERDPSSILEAAGQLDAWSVNPRYDLATGDFCRMAHRRSLQVFAWTVDEPGLMRIMIRNGVDGIMTNYPDRVRRLVT
jgi:glycerophosphoryl diester phosphodiesterase